MESLHSLKRQMASRVLLMDVLSALFGMGSWLSMNGIYTQLPLLVDGAPESWNLSSYIVIVCHAGNIGLIIYDVIQRFWRKKISDDFLICLLMSSACISLFLMAFFYSQVTVVGGSPHSLALLILIFGCALVACTSSVLFIPYLNRYRETYLISYMIGEGLSSFIPSIISLVQGVGFSTCVQTNSSDPNSALESVTVPPNFSITSYLIIMSCLQALSLLAFFLLKILPSCKKERVKSDIMSSRNHDNTPGREAAPEPQRHALCDNKASHTMEGQILPTDKRMDRKTISLLLTFQTLLSFMANGLFPSIQTYSCRPYGNLAYHLSINLGSISNPLACYILFFITLTSLSVVSLLFAIGSTIGVYIFIAATMSPDPPLVGTMSGEVLVVVSWIIYTGLVSYVKLAIATRFRQRGGKGLFWYGTMTQVGAATGAVIGFVLLNYTSMFTEYNTC